MNELSGGMEFLATQAAEFASSKRRSGPMADLKKLRFHLHSAHEHIRSMRENGEFLKPPPDDTSSHREAVDAAIYHLTEAKKHL
jgi:hypothetical protein